MKSILRTITLTLLAAMACSTLMAQTQLMGPGRKWTGPVIPYQMPDSIAAQATFLNTLSTDPSDLYDDEDGFNYVLGPSNTLFPGIDQNMAVRFKPSANGHVKTLQLGIAADAVAPGNPRITISVNNDDGTTFAPGTVIPGGSKTTLAPVATGNNLLTVNFGGAGVAVTGGTFFWVVVTAASTAPTCAANWFFSHPLAAFEQPSSAVPWSAYTGALPAIQIRGTIP